MNKLIIYEYQLKEIADALRLAARTLNSQSKETAMDRTIMVAKQYVENALVQNIDKEVTR